MLTVDKLVFEPIDDPEYPYREGYIDMPLQLLGQERFPDNAEDGERLGLSIPLHVDLEAIVEPLAAYLDWLSDCRTLLEEFYYREHKQWIDKCHGGKLSDDWYESLEMYSGTIDIDEDGAFSATFSCGDNMNSDHLLMIEFSDRELDTIWFDE